MNAKRRLQVNHTNFGGRPHAVPCLCRQAQYPGARIVNVDLGVTCMDSRQSNAVPPTQFHEIFDGRYSDLE